MKNIHFFKAIFYLFTWTGHDCTAICTVKIFYELICKLIYFPPGRACMDLFKTTTLFISDKLILWLVSSNKLIAH